MFTPVIGTLGYLLSPDGSRVLLVHRSRPGDAHAGKWNGLGGKLEPGEDVYSCLCREVAEEAGLQVTSARLRGTVSWPGFGAPTAGAAGLAPGSPSAESSAEASSTGHPGLAPGSPSAESSVEASSTGHPGLAPGSPAPASAAGEDWFGFIFVVDGWSGDVPESTEDGPLEWHRIDALDGLPMWEGDRFWLPLVFADGPVFHGVMPYVDGRPAGWSYTTPG